MQVLARMEANGVSLECDLLGKMSRAINKQINELADKIYQQAGFPFNIDSTKQLAEVLFDRLGLQSIRQGKTLRSTDADVLEQLSSQHRLSRWFWNIVSLSSCKIPISTNCRC